MAFLKNLEISSETLEDLMLLFHLPGAENGKNTLFRNTISTVSCKLDAIAPWPMAYEPITLNNLPLVAKRW